MSDKVKPKQDDVMVRGMLGVLKNLIRLYPRQTIKYLREMGIDIRVVDTTK
jgi:hypothetical protein